MMIRDDVAIETPCGMDFRKMTRKEATQRFCGACTKHVHDLASMTEGEARALLAAPSTEGLCVRYVADETGRLQFLPDVPVSQLTARRRAVLAVSAMAAAMSLTACMGAAPQPARNVEVMGGMIAPPPPEPPKPGVVVDPNAAQPTGSAVIVAKPSSAGAVIAPDR